MKKVVIGFIGWLSLILSIVSAFAAIWGPISMRDQFVATSLILFALAVVLGTINIELLS